MAFECLSFLSFLLPFSSNVSHLLSLSVLKENALVLFVSGRDLVNAGSHLAAHRLLCVSTPLSAPSGRSPPGATWKDTVRAALGGHVFVQIPEGWVRLKRPLLGLCNLRAPLFLSLSLFQRFRFSDVLFRQSASGSPHQEVGNFRKEIWIAAYHRGWCVFGFQKEWGLRQGVTEITP